MGKKQLTATVKLGLESPLVKGERRGAVFFQTLV